MPTGRRHPAREYALVQIRYMLREHVGDAQEWRYTWQINDDVTFSGGCSFCGRAGLRLTYEVTHQHQCGWICEYCVGRYDISADLDGDELGPKAARAYAHGLTARLKQQTCKDIIRWVQDQLTDADLEEVAVYFARNLQLSPLWAARLFLALMQIGQEAQAQVFEVQTRSKLHQQEFGDLDEKARSLVWIALSQQQRRRLASLGFAPLGTPAKRVSPAKVAQL